MSSAAPGLRWLLLDSEAAVADCVCTMKLVRRAVLRSSA